MTKPGKLISIEDLYNPGGYELAKRLKKKLFSPKDSYNDVRQRAAELITHNGPMSFTALKYRLIDQDRRRYGREESNQRIEYPFGDPAVDIGGDEVNIGARKTLIAPEFESAVEFKHMVNDVFDKLEGFDALVFSELLEASNYYGSGSIKFKRIHDRLNSNYHRVARAIERIKNVMKSIGYTKEVACG